MYCLKFSRFLLNLSFHLPLEISLTLLNSLAKSKSNVPGLSSVKLAKIDKMIEISTNPISSLDGKSDRECV